MELKYFETSAVNWLEERLSIGDAIATRSFQEVRGRAWVLSPVVLWEMLLTKDVLRRERLIYFCQRLFHRNLLKSPEEILVGYIERGCPVAENPRSMMAIGDMATVWRDLCECPDKTFKIEHEEMRGRASAVQGIVRDVHRIAKEEKVNFVKYGTERPLDSLLELALAQMPSRSGCPAINREERILTKIAIFYAFILLCAEVGIDPVPVKAYWDQIGIHAVVDRLFYLLRNHEACVVRGPLFAMALMTKAQCEGKYSRGVYFDSLHALYLTFVNQFFAEDSHFYAFRDALAHIHGRKLHRLSDACWKFSRRVNPEYNLVKRV